MEDDKKIKMPNQDKFKLEDDKNQLKWKTTKKSKWKMTKKMNLEDDKQFQIEDDKKIKMEDDKIRFKIEEDHK